MLSGHAAVQAIIEDLRARSWVIAGTPEEDVWTATGEGRPRVTLRLPPELLGDFLAELTREGIVADLFGDLPPGRTDAALAAYVMERLDEILSLSSASGTLVEAGLRSSPTTAKPELYSVRDDDGGSPTALHGVGDDLHWTPIRPTGAGPQLPM